MNMRVKVCGITTVADAEFVARSGASAIGLVFYAKSGRYVHDLDVARDIALAVGPFVTVTGLFVDADPAFVNEVLERVPLGLLQFHGKETEAYCLSFSRPYLKAIRMREGLNLEQEIGRYQQSTGILLDAFKPGVPGGTGETFNWSNIPSQLDKPIVLAGGLTPNNVAEAITRVRPWAVDVSGGVETSPGVKSPSLVSEFLSNAHP